MAGKDPRIIGARIARRRHQLGWSQIELAAQLGVSPSSVANWERGASYPKKKIGKVEQVLGISLDGLDAEAADRPPPVPRDIADSIARSPGLTDDDRQRVMEAIARTLAGDPQPSPTEPDEAAQSPAARQEQRAGLRSRSCG